MGVKIDRGIFKIVIYKCPSKYVILDMYRHQKTFL